MRFSVKSLFVLAAVPVTVLACEGECIVSITNAFLGNYTTPVNDVLFSIAGDISSLLPNDPGAAASMQYLQPIVDAYKKNAYSKLETAIFPGYFHGKCQQNGVDPPGCPNPDCPVVCGTPGSMVHFYSKLRYIAFNETSHNLAALTTPGSNTYDQVEQAVLKVANKNTRRMSRLYARASPYGTTPFFLTKRTEDVKTRLKQIMSKLESLLLDACGGEKGETNGLPKCSWEDAMKAYILSFP